MPIDFRASQIQTNKLISSGSTGTPTGARLLVYPHVADDGTSPNQGYINQSVFVTSSIGTDIFLYVSGGIGERNVGGAQSITCFGGDVHISGNLTVNGTSPGGGGGSNFFWSPSNPFIEASGSLAITGSGYFKGGLSGSLQEISSGVPYLLAGPNITVATNSLGQISITGSASGGGSSFYRLEVLDYYSTNATADTTAGQVIFPANQFTGSIVLYGVIANSSATATGSVRLYNVTSGSYVDIGGVGNQYLSVSGTTPTIVSSVNLISASNFNSSSQAIYELQVSSSNGASYGFFGGFELRPSGSFTGISYITSSTYYTYVSGTWEDGGDKLATTSSVAIAGNLGTGYFADAVGADVYFFVSGSSGSKDGGTPGVSVFGGDVVISGVLHGGSPLKIGSPAKFFQGLSGSITTLADGSPLFIGVGGVSISTNSLGQIAITGSAGGNSLQDAYNAGLPLIGLNNSSGSITITGSLTPTDVYPSLLSLKSGFGGPHGSNYNAIDVYGWTTTEIQSASLVNIRGNGSNGGGGQVTLRSTGDVNGRIRWVAGSGELYSSSPAASIQYHPNASALKISNESSTGKVSIVNTYTGGQGLLVVQNGSTWLGGEKNNSAVSFFPDPVSPFMGVNTYGTVYNSGSLEQSGSASFKNKVEISASLTQGYGINALGNYSHAQGHNTKAYGDYSHTEGYLTEASGTYSHAGGIGTIASGSGQTVIGSYNLEGNADSLFVIGDGKFVITQAYRGDIVRVNKGSNPGYGIVEVTGSLSVSGSGGSNGTFNQYNGLRYYPKIVTTLPYTASLNDYIIAVSASTGDGVALPSASEFGRTFIVKDVSGSAGQNLLTITAASGELIDGSPSATIAIDYGSAKFVYFGSGIGWGVV